MLSHSEKKKLFFFSQKFGHSKLIFFETLTFLEPVFRGKLENRVHLVHKWLQTDLSGICRRGPDCNDEILVISTKINVNLNENRVVLCQKTIAIAINRPQMSVCMNMMCYEHLTGPISHLLSADICFWLKKINTRRDYFKSKIVFLTIRVFDHLKL